MLSAYVLVTVHCIVSSCVLWASNTSGESNRQDFIRFLILSSHIGSPYYCALQLYIVALGLGSENPNPFYQSMNYQVITLLYFCVIQICCLRQVLVLYLYLLSFIPNSSHSHPLIIHFHKILVITGKEVLHLIIMCIM